MNFRLVERAYDIFLVRQVAEPELERGIKIVDVEAGTRVPYAVARLESDRRSSPGNVQLLGSPVCPYNSNRLSLIMPRSGWDAT